MNLCLGYIANDSNSKIIIYHYAIFYIFYDDIYMFIAFETNLTRTSIMDHEKYWKCIYLQA